MRTGCSGQFRVRLPHTLHEWLALQAQREGVSLNTLVLGCLAEAKGRSEAAGELAGQSA